MQKNPQILGEQKAIRTSLQKHYAHQSLTVSFEETWALCIKHRDNSLEAIYSKVKEEIACYLVLLQNTSANPYTLPYAPMFSSFQSSENGRC